MIDSLIQQQTSPPVPQSRAWRVLGCVLLAGLLGACAHGPESDVTTQALRAPTPWDVASVGDVLPAEQAPSATSRWQHLTFPGKTANQFAYLQVDGRRAMGVRSGSAVSMLRKIVSIRRPPSFSSTRLWSPRVNLTAFE